MYVIELDEHGRQTAARVDRAIVRSHQRLAYGEAEVPLLEQIGTLRLALARERGSITLNAPAQTVVADPSQNCGYRLEARAPLAGRGLERRDLAAGRDGRGRHHGVARTGAAAHDGRRGSLPGEAAAGGCHRPGSGLARGPAVRRVRDLARSGAAAPGGADRGGTGRDGTRRLRLLRGHAAGGLRARRHRRPLRPHDRAAAAAGRPLRARPGGRWRRPRGAREAARGDERGGLARRPGGAGDRGRRRDAGARAPRGRAVHRRRPGQRPPRHRDPDRRPAGAGARARRSGTGAGRHRGRAADAGRPGVTLARVPPGWTPQG